MYNLIHADIKDNSEKVDSFPIYVVFTPDIFSIQPSCLFSVLLKAR